MKFFKIFSCILVSIFPVLTQAGTTIDEFPGDNFYPMTSINNGKLTDLVFLNNATVKGDGVDDEHGVLSLTGSGYVAFEGYANDCLMDPTNCVNGFTISFWMKHGGFISNILGVNNAKYQTALDNWLSPIVPKKSRWMLCYRASEDGWKGNDFKSKCKDKTNTLIIVKVRDYVFGGFRSDSWISSGPSSSRVTRAAGKSPAGAAIRPSHGPANSPPVAPVVLTPKAFLFSLNNPLGTQPFQLTLQSGQKVASLPSMPSFGDGDLVLVDDANTTTQSTAVPGKSYKIPDNISSADHSNLFAGSSPFLVDEIEVFYNTDLKSKPSYILTSGAEDSSNTGFTIYSSAADELVAKVTTKTNVWEVNAGILTKAWHHVALVWDSVSGLKLHKDGSPIAFNSTAPSSATSKKTSLSLGSSVSSSTTVQNLQMYGLILWRLVVTDVEINKYKDRAFSPMSKEKVNFNWKTSTKSTPTMNTGPTSWIINDRKYYLNFTHEKKHTKLDKKLKRLAFYTVCWKHNWYTASDGTILHIESASTNSEIKISFCSGNKKLCIMYSGSKGSGSVVLSPTITDHTWHSYCVIFNTTNINIYMSGQNIPWRYFKANLPDLGASSITFWIGADNSGSPKLDGLFTDFNLWDRVLTKSEITKVCDMSSTTSGNIIAWTSIAGNKYYFSKEWFFIESSYPRLKDDSAKLITSEYIPHRISCLRFSYILNGKDIGRLNVYLKANGKLSLIWSLGGDQRNSPKTVYVTLNVSTVKSKIVFEGIVGDSYLGDIAVGNILLLTTNFCSGGSGQAYKPVHGIKSRIIGNFANYTGALQGWLTDAKLNSPYWVTCYSLDIRGWLTSKDLFNRCGNQGPTIFLFRHNDDVIGGVFDQSWPLYGQSKTLLPSENSFLFSFKSKAGPNPMRFPIKSKFRNLAFDNSDPDQQFPDFGDDLVLYPNNKNLKATYGDTYGSTSGNFFTTETVTPSDIEILRPQVRFCPTKCSFGMICDNVKGSCVCNKNSRLSEVCQTNVFVEDLTRDAFDFFTFFTASSIRSHRRPVWGKIEGTTGKTKSTKGIIKQIVSIDKSAYVTINDVHPCLTNPSQCSSGMTVSMWLRYSLPASGDMHLFCSDSCLATTTGFRISKTNYAKEALTFVVTTKTKQCSREVDIGQGVWTHIAFSMTSMKLNNTITIYKNGVMYYSMEICKTGNYNNNTKRNVIIGKTAVVDVDAFVVWDKVVASNIITKLHDIYKGRKKMTLDIVFTPDLPVDYNPETKNYQSYCDGVDKWVDQKSTAGKPVTKHCSLKSPSGTSSNVYDQAKYATVQPLFKETIMDANYDKATINSTKLDTVYYKECTIKQYKALSNSVYLEWAECGQEPAYGLLYGFKIIATDSATNEVKSMTFNSGTTKGTITNLKYTTKYSIVIEALTFEGVGKPSSPIEISTEQKSIVTPPWSVNATALVTDNSSIQVEWAYFALSSFPYVNGYQINFTSGDKVERVNITVSNARGYIQEDLPPLTTYNITVQVYNQLSISQASKTVTVTTVGKPLKEKPTQVSVSAIDYKTVTVSWKRILPDENVVGRILKYQVKYSSTTATDRYIDSTGDKVNITGLMHLTKYSISVRGYTTGYWYGPSSTAIEITTPEGAPSASPKNPVISLINSTSFGLSWGTIDSTRIHGILKGYHIIAEVANGKHAGKLLPKSFMRCHSLTSFTFRDLLNYTDYKVKVAGFTSFGIGVELVVKVSNANKGPIKPPASLGRVGDASKATINITWGQIPVGSSNSPIVGYAILIKQYPYTSSTPNRTISVNGENTMSHQIDALLPYTKYVISVAGVNEGGIGVFSPAIHERTKEEAPTTIVSNASTSKIGKYNTTLQWSPLETSSLRGNFLGYILTVYDTLRGENTTRYLCSSVTSLNIPSLLPYTPYSVYLAGFSGGGSGQFTKTTEFRTTESAPEAPPQNVTSQNTSSSGIKLEWQPPPILKVNGKVRSYFVEWYETLASNPEIFNKTVTVPTNSVRRRRRRSTDGSSSSQALELTGLKKFTLYTIRISAFTVENGVFFQTNATTAEDVPSVPPPNVTAHNTSSTTIAVIWQPIPEAFRHGVFRGYHVFYQRSDKPDLTPLLVTVDYMTHTATLTNLSKYTIYNVSVAGFTTPGTGNVSEIVNVITDQDIPDEAPYNFSGKTLSTTELFFSWLPIALEKRNGIILGYTLTLHFMNGSLAKTVTINNASVLNTTTGGLEVWVNYTIQVNCFTIKGPGPWSEKIRLTTLEEVPLPPTNIVASMINSTALNVTWNATDTTFLRGILRFYRVIFTSRGSVFPHVTRNVTTTADILSVVLTDLHKFTEYEVVMTALTIADGNRSALAFGKTDSDIPTAGPSELISMEATAYRLTIELGPVPPRHRNGILSGLKVVVNKEGSSAVVAQQLYRPADTVAVIDGLKPYTNYIIAVSASTDKGYGTFSNVTLQTDQAAPSSEPGNLIKPLGYNVDSIPLQWAPISKEEANGIVIGYRITYQLVTLGEEPVDDAPIQEVKVTETSTILTGLELYGRYKITISAYTERGEGPRNVLYGETCRCRQKLYANWREYRPYVTVSNTTGAPEGILPQVITEMTEACCQRCVAHNFSVVDYFNNKDGTSALKLSEDELKTNISEEIDFTFPIYGTMDQKAYPGGFGYRALMESPGIVFVVNSEEEFKAKNPDSPSNATIKNILRCLLYIFITVIIAYVAGFIIWLLDRQDNPDFFPPSFTKGTYEGFWWAFITMTTLGYGDRYPTSFIGRSFSIAWMLMGIVIYGFLCGILATALTTKTVTFGSDVSGKAIVAIHNSPEYQLGKRLKTEVNKETQPKTFQEVYDALIQKKAYGAFIDGYAIGDLKHLFEHPSLKFAKIYDVKPAYGIVLGGTSSRLRRCFYSYMQDKRAEIFKRISKYAKIVESEKGEPPRTVQYSTNLFTPNTATFTFTVLYLSTTLAGLIFLGIIYEIVRRYRIKQKDDCPYKLQDIQYLKNEVQRFLEKMTEIQHKLKQKHLNQLRQYLNHQKREKSKSHQKVKDLLFKS